MNSRAAELPAPAAANPVASGGSDRSPRVDDVACWFDIGAGNGIVQTPARADHAGGATRALRHLLLRGLAATGAADDRASADDAFPVTSRDASRNAKPGRSTFPGSTTFKALCNSYLRKLLRGAAPESLYWVAHATLPDGDHVFARLRLTFTIEDVRVEKIRPLLPPTPARRVHFAAQDSPSPYQPQTEWIRELG
jgi:hypothetical protein